MAVVSVVCLCVAGALACTLLRVQRPEMKLALVIAVSLGVMALCMEPLAAAVETLRTLAVQAGLQDEDTGRLVRAIGVALLCEFGAQLCRDAEESALAGRVELAGRVALLGMTAPLMADLTQRLTALLP